MKCARLLGPVLLSAGLGLAASAHAEGWYVVAFGGEAVSDGLNQNRLDENLVDVGFDLQSSSLDDSDTGFGLAVGYQVNRNFAAELAYVDLGEVSYSATNGQASPGNQDVALDTSAAGPVLSLLGILPVSSRFDVYARAGLAVMNVDGEARIAEGDASERVSDSTTRSNAVFGVGGQYSFNNRFAVRLEWDRHFDVGSDDITGESDIDLFALGLRYNFR